MHGTGNHAFSIFFNSYFINNCFWKKYKVAQRKSKWKFERVDLSVDELYGKQCEGQGEGYLKLAKIREWKSRDLNMLIASKSSIKVTID